MHSAGRDRGLLRRSRHSSKVRDPMSRDCRIVGRDRSTLLVHFIVWRATVSRWRTSSPACRYKLVVVNDACPRLSLTVRRSSPPSAMCEPAVWRNQCADARSSSSARSPNSGPRERNHAAAPRNMPLMASCTAERWRHRLAPLNGIKSGVSSEREGRGQRPFASRYRRSSLTRSAETGTIRSFSRGKAPFTRLFRTHTRLDARASRPQALAYTAKPSGDATSASPIADAGCFFGTSRNLPVKVTT
ncbi:hypothetical protein BLA39750_01273 [Burkholderia lata]|uniref:Uncharacterized protein n=1 Tax=Burkholderia lata (strain ATCC 17760 / DSM 23089 / LMG 22485 / NCIMB 9086 / R18194 / 383) TaxID=482957 RepID=A0A6P2UX19_BURL3|nr:hypothetical protein BLA39750_01273 [Burkholderia lata]